MPGDLFEKVATGDRLAIRAPTWNAVLDSARAFAEGHLRQGGPVDALPETSTEVLVKNTTAGAVPQFANLTIGGPLVARTASAATFYESRTVGGVSTGGLPFVITQEPIGVNAIGRATLVGLTPCQVNITDGTHTFAVPTAGDPTKLTSTKSANGAALIVWVEGGFGMTGSSVWCLVLLGAPGIGYTAFGADGIIDGSFSQYIGGRTDALGFRSVKTFHFVGFNGTIGDGTPDNPKAFLTATTTGGAAGHTADWDGLHVETNWAGPVAHQNFIARSLAFTDDQGASGLGTFYSIWEHKSSVGATGGTSCAELRVTGFPSGESVPVAIAGVGQLGLWQALDPTDTFGSSPTTTTQSALYLPGVLEVAQGISVRGDFGAGVAQWGGIGDSRLGLHFVMGVLVHDDGGPVGVADGGTGAGTFAPGEILFGNGTGAIGSAAGAQIDPSGDLAIQAGPGKLITLTTGSF